MKSRWAGALAVALMVVLAAGFYAMAQEGGGGGARGGGFRDMTPEQMMERTVERMKEGGASEGLIMRYKQIQTSELAADEPAGLLALKDDLKLTPEQVTTIQQAADEARAKARAALTPEQVAMIEKMNDTPKTALAVSSETRGMMGRGRRGE